jgi:FkbM family methyltransferase
VGLLNAFRSSPIGRLFETMDLHIMDVGARGGIDEDCLPAAWATTAAGFEPEPDECARLNRRNARPWRAVRFVPAALGGFDGTRVLNLPQRGEAASLLRSNPEMLLAFGYDGLHGVARPVTVQTLTLDSACDVYQLTRPDYLKIDVEGAELEILMASPLALLHCSAVKLEVSFLEQRMAQPMMHDLVAFMLNAGFILADIRGMHYWRRRPLPAHPYSARWVIPYSKGVAAQCDLVFLREAKTISSDESLVRLIAVASILGFFDHAVSAMRQVKSMESDLCQRVGGSFVGELGQMSKRIGRAVAVREIKSGLRTMVPLVRSLLNGIPQRSPVPPGY